MSPGDRPLTMPTYTAVWRIERKLYKIHDLELPSPVAAVEAAVFVVFTVVFAALLTAVGVGFTQYTGCLFVVPPVVATWCVRRPVADGKTIPAYLAALARLAVEPRVLDGLVARHEPDRCHLAGRIHCAMADPPAVKNW